MKIYLDNAATTKLSQEVFRSIEPYLFETFGNPSSAHQAGTAARAAVEEARCSIAEIIHAEPRSIIFTSGGTEADNLALTSAVRANGIRVAITSPLEHHAVLRPLRELESRGELKLIYLKHNEYGAVSLSHLDQLLSANERALVTLMHGNNETGNLNDIHQIGEICGHYQAVFHTDTVQSIYQYHLNVNELKADFLVGSAHKFHGPKGIGFLYARHPEKLLPLISGGGQERGYRSGTENVAGIAGLASALRLSHRHLEKKQHELTNLKEKMINNLLSKIPGVRFNGLSGRRSSLPTILNVSLPEPDIKEPVLSYLDRHGICASGSSACSAHSTSHVLSALGIDGKNTIRFSFSSDTTAAEIDQTVDCLARLYVKSALREVTEIC